MDLIKRTPLVIRSDQQGGNSLTPPKTASDNNLSSVFRLVGSFDELDDSPPPKPQPSMPDWSGVIERVHQAAARVREVETQAHEQELRIRELLQHAREDVGSAAERARAADARAAELQARSEALLKAADARVKAAEERARIAEEWLAKLHDAIVSEFGFDASDDLTAR